MFRELVELGRELEAADKLPPVGFYEYGEPIRWFIHLWPDHAVLEPVEWDVARPYSGRTSSREPHLLADEASYCLGVSHGKAGKHDRYAMEKHGRFRELCQDLLGSVVLHDASLRDAVVWLLDALERGWIMNDERYNQVLSKDWVSFVPERGALTGTHLFQHPDARRFWVQEMERRSSPKAREQRVSIAGTCAVCGQYTENLVGKLPVQVKLAGMAPLHSLNADAYTSFIGRPGSAEKAHLGICFSCGDTAARAFNFLSDSDQHRRQLVRDPRKRDGLANHIALFWLKAPAPIQAGETTLDFSDMMQLIDRTLASETQAAPRADLSQAAELLNQPWRSSHGAFRLDDYGFYLAVLSPNVGRIALRDWIAVSLAELKANLAIFMEGSRMISAWGDKPRPVSIRPMVEALATANPNITRALLRTAYTGAMPPASLSIIAGQRLNHLIANETSLREQQKGRGNDQARAWGDSWLQALAAAIKLGLFHKRKEAEYMDQVNPMFKSKGYHCGRLLAVLEEAQQIHNFWQYGKRLDTTMVTRSYGGASSRPKTALTPLLRLAATAHLQDAGGGINQEVETIISMLVELGGMPGALSLSEQAEFGLGFFHQRAQIRASRAPAANAGEVETSVFADEDVS